MKKIRNRIFFGLIFLFFALRLADMGFVSLPATPNLFQIILSLIFIFGFVLLAWLNLGRLEAVLLASIWLLELAGKYFQVSYIFVVGCILSVIGIGIELLKSGRKT